MNGAFCQRIFFKLMPAQAWKNNHQTIMSERYLRSIRLLAECLQDFGRISTDTIHQFDLTHAQFDIIATLGNTPGMSCKTLGEKTLITKGTMTGVLDRLEKKQLLERSRSAEDKRSYFIKLTKKGEQVFADVFPQVVNQGRQIFAHYTEEDFDVLERQLHRLKKTINGNGVSE